MNSVNYKASLMLGDGQVEIRRFTVNVDIAASLICLQQKLQTIFPQLNGNQFRIVWNDSDNDEVTIGSDDELSLALISLSDDLKRIKIYPKQCSVEVDVTLNAAECEGRPYKKYNQNVICDGCNSNIDGFRYKCLQCSNYDLCESCESQDLHSHHMILKLPQAIPHEMSKDFFKKLHIAASNFASNLKSNCFEAPCSDMHNCDFAKYARKKWKNKHKGMFSHHNFTDLDEECSVVKRKHREIPPMKCPRTLYNMKDLRKRFDDCVNLFAPNDEMESEKYHASPIASTIENTFTNVITPFVQAFHQGLTPKTRSETGKGPSTSSQESKISNGDILRELVEKLRNENKTNALPATTKEAPVQPSVEPTAPTETQPGQEKGTNSSPSAPPNPKIEDALKVMLSMGFTNEQNHLRNIIEEMDGDIGRVLECIDNALKL